jgi:integrase
LIDTYLERFGKEVAESTLRNYKRFAATIRTYFGSAPVEQVTTGHIQEFLDLSTKRADARNTVTFFSTMMKKSVQWGWRADNPCASVEKPPPSKRKRYMTDAEFLAIRERLPEHFRIAMDLAYLLSLAVSDVAKIKLSDIRDGRLYMTRKKTGKALAFEMTSELEEVIARAKALKRPVRGLFLLCSMRGRPYNAKTLSRAISEAAKALGIEDVRFHDLRAKSASDEQETAQRRLGHADPRTTAVYLRKPEPVAPIRRKL